MTDIQILTLALTMLGIFAASWFNNSRVSDVSNRISDLSNKLDNRISDTKDVLRSEMHTFRAEIHSEMNTFRAEMHLEFERMNNKLDAILLQLGNHETRITRLEERNS